MYSAPPLNEPRREHRGEGQKAAHGEVNSARNDDHRHPNGDDCDDGDLVGHVSKVARHQKRCASLADRRDDLSFAKDGEALRRPFQTAQSQQDSVVATM